MDHEQILKELKFRTSRSSGSGGQNVNKVETRVEALFDIASSTALTEDEKTIINSKLANRINKEGILTTSAQESRTQHSNREKAIKKMLHLLEMALEPDPIREEIPERLTANPQKRKREKAVQSEKKTARKKITPPNEED